jgi:hypothetical protein
VGILNRIPVGLLGFLGLKAANDYPSELGRVLEPSIELLGLYAVQNAVIVEASGTIVSGITIFGPGATSQPRGPVLVLNFGVRVDCSAAGSNAVATLGVTTSGSAAFVPIGDGETVNNRNGAVGIAGPLWVGENESVAVNFRDVALVPTYVASVRYVAFPPG